jgi:hypothetical protein
MIDPTLLKCEEKELPTCSVFESLSTLAIGEWCLTDDLYVVLRFLQLFTETRKTYFKAYKGILHSNLLPFFGRKRAIS